MIAHRLAEPEDRTFIIDAWLSSFRTSNHAGLIPMDMWRETMWPTIERIIDRDDMRTLVAHETSEPDRVADLYGFLTYDTTTWQVPMVFYAYTKQAYRRAGIARGLFAAAGIDPARPFFYACKTAVLSDLQRKIPLARWRPLLARFPKERP